jgi:PAS domain-containing protein
VECGADGFLTEPVEPPVLLATVHALLRLRRAEETLRMAGREWQVTFDAIQDGICLLDGLTVLRCNTAFGSLFSRSWQDLVGVPWTKLWLLTPEPPQAQEMWHTRPLQRGRDCSQPSIC